MPDASHPKKILLADDEAHITHVMARALQTAGFEVHTAEDGEEALETALEICPDIIVTDLQMPYMSGIDLARKLHEHATLSACPIILLSARGYVVENETGMLTNIRTVLSKPFSAKDIVAQIQQILGDDSEGERSQAG